MGERQAEEQLFNPLAVNLQLLRESLANHELLLRLPVQEGQTMVHVSTAICSVLGWAAVVKALQDKLAQLKLYANSLVDELDAERARYQKQQDDLEYLSNYQEVFEKLVKKEWRKARGRRPLQQICAEAHNTALELLNGPNEEGE
jgi:hypothetical protein